MNNILSRILVEAGRAKSRSAQSLEDTNYIFNNLLNDMKNDTGINKLFNTVNQEKKKNFYNTYINNYQLNDKGKQLANRLEDKLLNWTQKNIHTLHITNLYTYITEILKNINYFTNLINDYEYDTSFNNDFKDFLELACKHLYNQANSRLKAIIDNNIKQEYKITDEDISTLADEIYIWWNNNFNIIYTNYINKGNFNLIKFLKNYWINNINKVYDILVINQEQYSLNLQETMKKLINKAINKTIADHTFSLKKKNNQYTNLEKQVLDIIKNKLNDILEYITFPKERMGLFTHSWLGKSGTRQDAKPIIDYLSINPQFCKLILNIDVDDIEQKTHLHWKDFLRNVRDYLVKKNIPIHNKHGKDILDISDKKGDYTYIPFSARKDQMRSTACICVNANNKNYVLIGNPGVNHGSILTNQKYEKIFNNCYSADDTTKTFPKIAFVYIVGNIAFLNKKEYCGYSSFQEVADILINDSRIEKVYYLPPEKGGKVYRLAKLIQLI